MSKTIVIAGEPGSGKTTSIRNLDPKETYYMDCDKKGLNWRGWREQYNAENHNYYKSSKLEKAFDLLKHVNDKRPEIHYLIIDTINSLMISDEISRRKEKGFDKWADLADCIYRLFDLISECRDDLLVILMAHTQTERDESGYVFTRIKTNGKKTDKIGIESRTNVVLLSKVENGKHFFEVHANNSTARTPFGAFEDDTIDNDITEVIKVLNDY